MPEVPSLNWLTQPRLQWLPCQVAAEFEPEGYAVQIQINGRSFAAVAPYGSVRLHQEKLPTPGDIRVAVLAMVGADSFLAELPAVPVNGTQRVTVKGEWLKD